MWSCGPIFDGCHKYRHIPYWPIQFTAVIQYIWDHTSRLIFFISTQFLQCWEILHFSHQWPEQWVTDAKRVACEAWNDNYKKVAPPAPMQPVQESRGATDHVSLYLNQCPLLLTLFYIFLSAFWQQTSTLMRLKTILPLLMCSKTG